MAEREPTLRGLPFSGIARRGRTIIADLPPELVAAWRGDVVVVDMLAGDYAVSNDQLAAERELVARRPASACFVVRVGGGASARIGSVQLDLAPR